MRRVEKNHRSKPVEGGGPRLLQGNPVRFPRLGQGPARPSGNLRIPVRDGRGPVEPSDHRETVRTLQFMEPEDVQTIGRDGRHGRPGTVAGQARHVDARPPGRTGRHGPVEEPAIPARTTHAIAARATHPRRHHRETRLGVDPDRSDPRLHDRHIQPRPTAQHHRRRYEKPYGQPRRNDRQLAGQRVARLETRRGNHPQIRSGHRSGTQPVRDRVRSAQLHDQQPHQTRSGRSDRKEKDPRPAGHRIAVPEAPHHRTGVHRMGVDRPGPHTHAGRRVQRTVQPHPPARIRRLLSHIPRHQRRHRPVSSPAQGRREDPAIR